MVTISKISYKGSYDRSQDKFCQADFRERHRKQPLLNCVSAMTDAEIVKASVTNAKKQTENSTAARVLEMGPNIFLAATALTYGALTKGKLSDKILGASKALATGAFIYAASKPVDSVINAAVNKVSGNDDNNSHPLLKTVLSVASLVSIAGLAVKGTGALKNKLGEVFAPGIQLLNKKYAVADKIERINSSYFGKLTDKMSASAQKFSQNHPKAAEIIKNNWLALPFLTFVTSSMAASSKLASNRAKITEQNINSLAFVRDFAAETLDSKN